MRALAAAAVLALVLAATARAALPGSLVKQGEHLYGQYCVACHGMNGSGVVSGKEIGAGPNRDQTQQRIVAPALRGVGALAADFYLRTGYMPLQRLGLQPRRSRVLFSDRQIRALVAYVASLAPGPGIPHPHPERGSVSKGLHLFTDHCAGCHQVVAEGGYVTGAVPPPLGDATSTQIAEAVRIGPNVMPRFSPKAISNAQLDSIIRYVQYAKHPDDRGGWALGHIGPLPEGLVAWLIAGVVLVFTCMVIGKRLTSE
ncbi:MAG TPA: cytochrome c [Gaiellaceae bacterium]|nr:cytochrome c [Gaiellaceae bacterium]